MQPFEERNDALKRGIKFAIERYSYACRKLQKCYIADAGCGMGYGTHMLSNQNRVIGIDKAPEAIHYAVNEYTINAIVGDIETFDFTGFNVIVCLEVLCHLRKPQEFLKNIRDKNIIISAPLDPNPNDGYIYRQWNLSEDYFRSWLLDWQIIDEFRQNDNGQVYLTLYGIPKSIN